VENEAKQRETIVENQEEEIITAINILKKVIICDFQKVHLRVTHASCTLKSWNFQS
jgi:hypothetical protein